MRVFFLFLDFVAFLVTSAAVIAVRKNSWDFNFFTSNLIVLIPSFCVITVILFIFSFYDFNKFHKIDYKSLAGSFIFTFLFSSTTIYFLASVFHILTPKTILVLIFVIYFLYIIFSRKVYLSKIKKQTNVVLIGKGRTLTRLRKELRNSPYYIVLDSFEEYTDKLPEKTEFVIISHSLLSNNRAILNDVFEKFLIRNMEVKTDIVFFEDFLQRTPIEGIKDSVWLFQTITTNSVRDIIYLAVKRSFDICTSTVMLAFFLPAMFIIYFLIKIIDRSNPVFSQERIGKMGKHIYIYKFRTMIASTEKITGLGKILRTFRLDEIPQLINILKGDISFVGPRPIWTEEYKFINEYIPNNPVRTMVIPGLTGHAQLNHRAPIVYCVQDKSFFENENTDILFDDAYKRLSYDIWYIKNRSFSLDIEIIFKTAKRMFVSDKNVK